jgi:hypothetical protein
MRATIAQTERWAWNLKGIGLWAGALGSGPGAWTRRAALSAVPSSVLY